MVTTYRMMLIGALAAKAVGAAPTFEIKALTDPHVVLNQSSFTTVQYQVTNKTKYTRTLTVSPLAGMTQNTFGPGVCQMPFTLAPGASCQLILNFDSSMMFNQAVYQITSGPVVCKTQNNENSQPDPYLCSSPARADQLNVRLNKPYILQTPILFPTNNSGGAVEVFNTSDETLYQLTAQDLPTGVSVDDSNCQTLPPRKTCRLLFSTGPDEVSVSAYKIVDSLGTEAPGQMAVASSTQVIGSATPGGWIAGTNMDYDSAQNYYYVSVNLTAGGEFKFRLNNAWDTNFGSAIPCNAQAAGSLYQDGPNIPFNGGDGNYRLIFNYTTKQCFIA